MTQRDKWAKRPAVMRYRAFCDQVRAHGVKLPESGANVQFFIPMPAGWSKTKKARMNETAHQQRPDLSNILKALEDSVYGEDSHIWHYSSICKLWSYSGGIRIF
jgi:Holliday junction resolvase RusA-like endonuclease